MISLESPDSDKPNSLPILTELADGNASYDLPTLTEVVDTAPADTPAAGMPDELPILLESVEIAVHTNAPGHVPENTDNEMLPAQLNETQLQQLEQQLAAHLETVLRDKLSLRLEQLQKLALEQMLSELKAELPMLLRDALSGHPESR